jgi:hypothetical protein
MYCGSYGRELAMRNVNKMMTKGVLKRAGLLRLKMATDINTYPANDTLSENKVAKHVCLYLYLENLMNFNWNLMHQC